jgi:hypothetical protein
MHFFLNKSKLTRIVKSLVNNGGYQSPLWLFLISQLSLILLYRPSRFNITTNISSIAFTASISACTTLRALQKSGKSPNRGW